MILSLEKSWTSRGGGVLITRTGNKVVRNSLGVKSVQFTEALGRDRKYGIGSVGGYVAVGGRV